MKRTIVCISIIFICLKLSAQKKTIFDQTHRHEIGVSVPSILSLGDDGLFLSYRYHLKKGALRFRINSESSTDQQVTVDENIYSNDGFLRLDVSIEKHKWFGKRWMMLYGVGLGYGRYISTETTIPKTNPNQEFLKRADRMERVIEPMGVWGIRYQVTPRVSFGTELNVAYQISFGIDRRSEAGIPTITESRDRDDLTNMYFPTSVYLQFTL